MTEAMDYAAALDRILKEDMASVLDRQRSQFDREIAPTGGKVALFGAGNLGRRMLARLRQDGIEPVCFADNGKHNWGTTFEGVPVFSPGEAAAQFDKSAVFVVTIWKDQHSFLGTRRQLRDLGCERVIPVTTLRWKYHETFLPFFWEELPQRVFERAEAVRQGMGLWADEFSRREYLAQIQWRARGVFEPLSPPVAGESYFPPDVFALRDDESLVDCGAFDGITVKTFLQLTRGQFKDAIAIEPDPANYRALQAYVAGLPEGQRSRVRTVAVAVGSQRGLVRFHADGSMGSAIDPKGQIEVECVPLDELLAGSTPTLLKMDIEGAEPDALEGAAGVIARHRPILTICVYHQQDHVWTVPAIIKRLCPEYSLYLRPHDYDGWQLVCYAVPPERVKR